MSEPIISPWIFYWINVLHCVKYLSIIILMFLILPNLFIIDNYSSRMNDKQARRSLVIIVIVDVVLLALTIFIPDKDTLYKMLVASYITPENINTGIQITKDGIQFIMQTIIDTAKQLKEM